MQSEFSIVRQDRFIQATRDSGYKGTESALSELIDNSIQAGATKVAIKMIADGEEWSSTARPKAPRVLEVVIADNGRGMDAKLLRRALRFGDSSRFNDRSGLGRFGMGLPNASVSQCERVEVFSWQKRANRQRPLWTYIDVKEIAESKLDEVPPPVATPIPAPYEDVVNDSKGTVIVWKRCDRLDYSILETLEKALRHSLGRIFRHFLIGDLEITINGTKVEPFDPLYLMPQARLRGDLLATQHGDVLKFPIPIPEHPDQTSMVEVTLSLLPEHWQISFNKDKDNLRRRHIDERNIFSVVRARREIDRIRDPYRAAHWTSDRWYRAEIRFEPELDEIFGVTHTKQHASIRKGTPIYEKLREAITANVITMIGMIKARSKKAHTVQTDRAEEAAQKVASRLKPVAALTEKTDRLVATEIKEFIEQKAFDKSSEERQRLEERLSKYEIIIMYEPLTGAPLYRTEVQGRTIILWLNTAHLFYERVYRRIEVESPLGKTGIDLLLMSLARSEAVGGEDVRIWYDDQRHEWSQHMKAFAEQLDEPEAEGPSGSKDDDLPTAPPDLA